MPLNNETNPNSNQTINRFAEFHVILLDHENDVTSCL